MGRVWGVVLAAGAGSRFGEAKQFRPVGGVRMVDRVVAAASVSCDGVTVVLPPGRRWDGPVVDRAVAGGAHRNLSVRAGLGTVPATAEIVVIADAAHPLASPALFRRVIAAVETGAAAVIPIWPIREVVRRGDGTVVDGGPLMLVQTPMAFRVDVLRRAYRQPDVERFSDDASLVEATGVALTVVSGEPDNLHVVDPAELVVAERLSRVRS